MLAQPEAIPQVSPYVAHNIKKSLFMLISFNANKKLPEKYLLETLQMTASHEIGHFQGLAAHSKRCVDVLSYYVVGGVKCTVRNGGPMPANFYEYRSPLPTACDIERCRSANKN